MAEVTRADRIAAALERWEAETRTYVVGWGPEDVFIAGDALAALLREPQPEPVNPPTNLESSTEAATWERINRTTSDTAHYSIFACKGNGMNALRQMFPSGKADELNMVLFSTSGVHGSYRTIEDVNLNDEDEPNDVTFLVIHPRIVCLRYGNATPRTADDVAWLKGLRASSLRAVSWIGQPAPAPVGGEDEALGLLETLDTWARHNVDRADQEADILGRVAAGFRAALADVARLTEERDSEREDRLNVEYSRARFFNERDEARAALAAAEQEKAKAVAEEREACRMIAANYALNCVDSAGRFAANTIGERIRARAGRNDSNG